MRVDVNEENMRLFGEESCVRVVGGDCAFPNALCSGLVACTWLVAGGVGVYVCRRIVQEVGLTMLLHKPCHC